MTSGIKRMMWTEEVKTLATDYLLEKKIPASQLSRELMSVYGETIMPNVLTRWLANRSGKPTAFKHGSSMRYDVATKARIVQKHIEEGISAYALGKDYDIAPNTVITWIKKFGDQYDEYIDAPAGIPYIVREDTMVQGIKNIAKMRELLEKQKAEIIAEATKNIDDEIAVLEEAEKIMKKMGK